mmetsp:Transcript_6548/g.16120  ORF Transcript_6548/g.16120 Transcript_6548/m.16120 type:complete len:481 (+) Transcript_6548:100-1542(+)
MEWRMDTADKIHVSDVAMRKRKQRESEERVKAKLEKILQENFPSKIEQNVRKRKWIDTELLLRNSVACIKDILSGGEGESSSELHCPLRDVSYREGLLASVSLGVLLVRLADLEVVESSPGVNLFCPFPIFQGYKHQCLSMMVHSKDYPVLKLLRQRTSAGGLGNRGGGTSVQLRLLRVSQELRTGAILSSWVRKEVMVSHSTSDAGFVILTFPMTSKDVQPLSTDDKFWESFYSRTGRFMRGAFACVPCTQQGAGLVESRAWGASRGVSGVSGDLTQQTFLKLAKDSIIRSSAGMLGQLQAVVEGSLRMMMVVERGKAGLPGVVMSSKFVMSSLSTPWNVFYSHRADGRGVPMGRLVIGVGQMQLRTCVFVPSDDDDKGDTPMMQEIMVLGSGEPETGLVQGVVEWVHQGGRLVHQGHLMGTEDPITDYLELQLDDSEGGAELLKLEKLCQESEKAAVPGFFHFPVEVGSMCAADGLPV